METNSQLENHSLLLISHSLQVFLLSLASCSEKDRERNIKILVPGMIQLLPPTLKLDPLSYPKKLIKLLKEERKEKNKSPKRRKIKNNKKKKRKMNFLVMMMMLLQKLSQLLSQLPKFNLKNKRKKPLQNQLLYLMSKFTSKRKI